MSYEVELRQLIKTATGLTRVNWGIAPDDSPYPLIQLNLVSELGDRRMSGPTGYRLAKVQVSIWNTDGVDENGDSDFEALIAAKEAILTLDGYTSSNDIRTIMLDSIRQDSDTTDTPLNCFHIDLIVIYGN